MFRFQEKIFSEKVKTEKSGNKSGIDAVAKYVI